MYSGSEEAANFEDAGYWNQFYGDEEEALYDWYSSEEFLARNIVETAKELVGKRGSACSFENISVLDIGCGTSPLLFRLYEEYGMKRLHGVDFSESAVHRCTLEKAERAPGVPAHVLSFTCMDARKLLHDAESVDIVVDKGCLDCFVNGDGGKDIDSYFAQIERVLKADGLFITVPTCGANIPKLFHTGTITKYSRNLQREKYTEGTSAWEANKRLVRASPFVQKLFIQKIRARDEKHIFFIGKQLPDEHTSTMDHDGTLVVNMISCDLCNKSYSYPGRSFPLECSSCRNRLHRFALS